MNHLVIVAKLKEGSQNAAEELIRRGRRFEPGAWYDNSANNPLNYRTRQIH